MRLFLDYAFQTDSVGRPTFYPWGVLGHGYALQSQDQLQSIRLLNDKRDNIAFALLSIGLVVRGPLGLLVALALFCVWDAISLPKITRALEKSNERYPYRRRVQGRNWTALILVLLAGIAFAILAIASVRNDPGYALGWFGIVMSVPFVGLAAFHIYVKYSGY